jgi:hypothetical protein
MAEATEAAELARMKAEGGSSFPFERRPNDWPRRDCALARTVQMFLPDGARRFNDYFWPGHHVEGGQEFGIDHDGTETAINQGAACQSSLLLRGEVPKFRQIQSVVDSVHVIFIRFALCQSRRRTIPVPSEAGQFWLATFCQDGTISRTFHDKHLS